MFCLFITFVSAENKISINGQLWDATNVITTTNSVKFSFWDALTGGTEYCSQTEDITPNKYGYYFTTFNISSCNVDWANAYLETEIVTLGITSPRIKYNPEMLSLDSIYVQNVLNTSINQSQLYNFLNISINGMNIYNNLSYLDSYINTIGNWNVDKINYYTITESNATYSRLNAANIYTGTQQFYNDVYFFNGTYLTSVQNNLVNGSLCVSDLAGSCIIIINASASNKVSITGNIAATELYLNGQPVSIWLYNQTTQILSSIDNGTIIRSVNTSWIISNQQYNSTQQMITAVNSTGLLLNWSNIITSGSSFVNGSDINVRKLNVSNSISTISNIFEVGIDVTSISSTDQFKICRNALCNENGVEFVNFGVTNIIFNNSGSNTRLQLIGQNTPGIEIYRGSNRSVIIFIDNTDLNSLKFRTSSTDILSLNDNKVKISRNTDIISNLNVTELINSSSICISGDCITSWSSISGDNESWNEAYADTLYAAIGSGSDNATWNEALADSLYYPLNSNPLGYLNTSVDSLSLSDIVSNIGNWSSDKLNIYTIINGNLSLAYANDSVDAGLTLSQVATNLGNFSNALVTGFNATKINSSEFIIHSNRTINALKFYPIDEEGYSQIQFYPDKNYSRNDGLLPEGDVLINVHKLLGEDEHKHLSIYTTGDDGKRNTRLNLRWGQNFSDIDFLNIGTYTIQANDILFRDVIAGEYNQIVPTEWGDVSFGFSETTNKTTFAFNPQTKQNSNDVEVSFFRTTNVTGAKMIHIYEGDAGSNNTISINATSGNIIKVNNIIQNLGNGYIDQTKWIRGWTNLKLGNSEIYLNSLGANADTTLYFYDYSTGKNRSIFWDKNAFPGNGNVGFVINENTYIAGYLDIQSNLTVNNLSGTGSSPVYVNSNGVLVRNTTLPSIPGTCPDGFVVQNTTINGVQCVNNTIKTKTFSGVFGSATVIPIINISNGKIVNVSSVTATGDIAGITTVGTSGLQGGCTSGTCTLILNHTYLNNTFLNRTSESLYLSTYNSTYAGYSSLFYPLNSNPLGYLNTSIGSLSLNEISNNIGNWSADKLNIYSTINGNLSLAYANDTYEHSIIINSITSETDLRLGNDSLKAGLNGGNIFTGIQQFMSDVYFFNGSYLSGIQNNIVNGSLILTDLTNNPKILLNATGSTYFNNGKIGIGTTNPASTLTVIGSVNITEKYYINETIIIEKNSTHVCFGGC